MTEKKLHQKTIGELEHGLSYDDGDSGEYLDYIDPEELKQWAVSVVKNCPEKKIQGTDGVWCSFDNPCLSCKRFIERFELTEEDLG